MPARRKYLVPKGLKPVRRTLASGETRLYWYHRATGKALKNDPQTAEGMLEVAALDKRAGVIARQVDVARGTYLWLWNAYTKSPEWKNLKPRTRSDYQAVKEWLGKDAERLLSDLTPGGVYKLRDKADRQKGRRFANYVVQVLRLTLEWGRKREMVSTNAAKEVAAIKRPTGAAVVNRAWTDAEVAAFAASAPPQIAVPFVLGLYAGMRQGDALIVTWGAYKAGRLSWIAGKNGEACSAPVDGDFAAWLDAAKARRGDTLQIAVTSTGSAWSQSGFRASFFKLVRQLVVAGKMEKGCTFHGLRHTIASGARDAGASNYQVAAAIGDRSTAMAETYGRDADRLAAQTGVLEANQKRFANIDWKIQPTEWKTRRGPK